jgi:hypothetical protein
MRGSTTEPFDSEVLSEAEAVDCLTATTPMEGVAGDQRFATEVINSADAERNERLGKADAAIVLPTHRPSPITSTVHWRSTLRIE